MKVNYLSKSEMNKSDITYWNEGISCINDTWEQAYRDFETPEQEIKKFTKRFERLGAHNWDKNGKMVSMFCGRGNGLVALERLGFKNLYGVDLSPDLLAKYNGPAKLFLGDCRDLKFKDNSVDFVSIHGGLHHLEKLPDDLEATLKEINRVLKKGGRFISVEPWLTPFLNTVHFVARNPLLRKMSKKIDAFTTMVELEYPIYDTWLAQSKEVLSIYDTYFQTEYKSIGFGKLHFTGFKKII